MLIQVDESNLPIENPEEDWIDVESRLPNERCLAFTPHQSIDMTYRIIPSGMFKQVASEATHWMPLPDTPIKHQQDYSNGY